MKKKEEWQPSKFEFRKGQLRASKKLGNIGVSSWLVADIIAKFYDEYLKEFAHGKLLDLGCGKVPLYMAYKPYIKENICVDWENSLHFNKYLDVYADLNKVLPLKSTEFDTVILSDVLEHIREPRLLFRELNRVLKKDGVLIMNVPFFYCLHEEPYDYYRYTRHTLEFMANESGFEIINLKSLGGVPEILTDIVSKNIIKMPKFGKGLAKFVQNFGYFFLKTKIGQNFSSKTSDRFPLAYGLIAIKQVEWTEKKEI